MSSAFDKLEVLFHTKKSLSMTGSDEAFPSLADTNIIEEFLTKILALP
jgi:hypothetical protein